MSKLIKRSIPVSLGLLGVCVSMLATRPAAAAEPSKPLVTAATSTLLVVNSIDVMRFRVGAGGFSAQQRWAIVNDRVITATAVDGPHSPFSVYTATANGEPSVYIRGHLIVTATPGDAAANGSTPSELASIWASNLRRAVNAAG